MNEYINLTLENIDEEHICCAIGDKKHQAGVDSKKEWIKSKLKDGHIFRKLNTRGKIFIEYEPIETAWIPISGKNYEYIYCLWVAGSFKGKGIGKELLEYAINDSKEKGKSGICTLVSKKKKPFIGEKKFFEHYGFKVVDTIGDYELLALQFDDSETPRFNDNARTMKIDNQDFTIYYSNECPYVEYEVNELTEYAKENNGVVTTAVISEKGILRGNLKKLVDEGRLEKTARGVYILPEIWEDEFVNLQARFKKGIFSNETALFLWDLTDRTPNRYDMTFPHNYNLTNVKKEGINCSRVKWEWYAEGKTLIESPGRNKITAYNMERTLCDILRKRGGTDMGIITESFKRYVVRKDKNLPLLSEYAKKFRVEEKVRSYLEVLI